MKQKPATAKAYAMRDKLQALVDRGIGGEKAAAKVKLDRLLARYNFTGTPPPTTADLFEGKFKPGPVANAIGKVGDLMVATFVKWSIERRTGLSCRLRCDEILAETPPKTASRLAGIVEIVARAFSELWKMFETTPGVQLGDKALFIRGLYDGMMDDVLCGEALPPRVGIRPARIGRGKRSLKKAPALTLHPYSVAVGLGRKIILRIPLADIASELETTLARMLEH